MAVSGFGAWLAARRVPRVAFIAGFFHLGLFGVVSTAVVVLSAIVRGWREAAADCVIAGGLLLAFAVVTDGPWQLFALSAGLIWSMAITLGALIGHFGTLILPIQTLLVAAAVGVVVFSVVVGDTAAYWQTVLEAAAVELKEAGVDIANADVLGLWAPLMTGFSAALLIISIMLSLVLGTWWATGAGGPALGPMFRSLRLGNVMGGAAAVAGVATMLGAGPLASDLLLVVATGFMLQGLAVVHWHARARRLPWAMLLAVYLPMFPFLMGPSVAAIAWLLIAAVGFVDNWFMLRRGGENMV
jgi:hypothetical protein